MNSKLLVVSLKSAVGRREQLKRTFPAMFPLFEIVEAVDGSKISSVDYFRAITPYFQSSRDVMSPGEVGCSLSHMRCYEEAVKANQPVLVLEDDVTGTDQALREAAQLVSELAPNELLFLGGQNGLSSVRHIRGRPCRVAAPAAGRVYRIHPITYRYLWRTCCYGVGPELAKHLLESQQGMLRRADEWHALLKHSNALVSYVDLIDHPPEETGSTLLSDRNSLRRRISLPALLGRQLGTRAAEMTHAMRARVLGLKKIARPSSDTVVS
ncbi:glycosyltransferase family 25 protein [Ramlibacter monticola]|uniref:Glycosyltransferase family 25 protein n=1 Tax=Ramlibacter monticola TaxID=1926872 RepID=A0A936Z6Q1_9BURK|nr:glycosyltransferase family 25 protein [Ramlibacter monticola]MBL0394121.1 glycosyltransferase family 25 protein [Ramlibacter monticola]